MAVKKIRFIDPTTAPPKPPTGLQIFGEVLLQVWTLALIFAVIIFVCAGLYLLGSKYGWGIQPTFTITTATGQQVAPPAPGFWDCLHFSVVTIATLGYGDYRPESYGRWISGFEVLAGIVLMGIFVARLVSHQQDRLTKRLVRGQINTEIQEFRDQAGELLKDFSAAPLALDKQQKSMLLYRARGLTQSIARFWRHEMSEPYMSEVVQARAVGRLMGDLIKILQAVIAGVSAKKKTDLHWEDFKAVRGIGECILVVSTCLTDLIDDHGLHHSHDCVIDLVKNLRKQLEMKRREIPQ